MALPSHSTVPMVRFTLPVFNTRFFLIVKSTPHPFVILAWIHPVVPSPESEKVHGLEPWEEFLVILLLLLQVMEAPAGRFVIEYEEPLAQVVVGPFIKALLVVLVVLAPVPQGSNQLLNLVALVPPPVQERLNLPYSALG